MIPEIIIKFVAKGMKKYRVYRLCGVSGKSFERLLKHPRKEDTKIPVSRVLEIAKDIEENHLLGMCSRELYKYAQAKLPDYKTELTGWTQRQFERVCLENGFRKIAKVFNPPTTRRGNRWHENYIENALITDIDQVWVCDITDIKDVNGKRIGYCTSILDVYSRKLLALVFSSRYPAEESSIAALKQAMKNRGTDYFPGLIFHTDCGSQFIDDLFEKMLKAAGGTGSMAQCCWDNAHSESYHDTLKNHQLSTTTIVSIAQLKVLAPKLMKQYNENKPHNGIDRLTPDEFEAKLLLTPISQRIPMIIQPSPLNQSKPNIVMVLLSELDLEYQKKLKDDKNK